MSLKYALVLLPWELNEFVLQSKYLLEKCINTRSRSWVSPVRLNCLRNLRRAPSNESFVKSKCLKYSSATARLKSLLKQSHNYRNNFYSKRKKMNLIVKNLYEYCNQANNNRFYLLMIIIRKQFFRYIRYCTELTIKPPW